MRQHLTAQTESTCNNAIYKEHISKMLVNERMGKMTSLNCKVIYYKSEKTMQQHLRD